MAFFYFFIFFIFSFQVPPSRRGEEEKRKGGRREGGHPVCVLRLREDGKHFCYDSAVLDTNINYFVVIGPLSYIISFSGLVLDMLIISLSLFFLFLN